jgi:hypothetical protein
MMVEEEHRNRQKKVPEHHNRQRRVPEQRHSRLMTQLEQHHSRLQLLLCLGLFRPFQLAVLYLSDYRWSDIPTFQPLSQ